MARRTFLTLDALTDRIAPAAGQLDPTFGTGGIVTTSFGPNEDGFRTIAIDSQNRMVVGGNSFNGVNWDFILARYHSNGELDESFDGDGKVTTQFSSGDDWLLNVKIDSQGRIVVGGRTDVGGRWGYAIARYNLNGALDNTFGSGGKVATSILLIDDGIQDLAIDNNDRIIVGGHSGNGTKFMFSLARYETNGALDLTFGSAGKVVTDVGPGSSGINRVLIDSLNRIVAGGWSYDAANQFNDYALARYNANGTLDTSFGTSGIVRTPIGAGQESIEGMTLDSSGRIIASGYSKNGNGFDFTLARYLPNGSLDTAFGSFGTVITPIGPADDQAGNVAVDGIGRIVQIGNGFYNGKQNLAVVRYKTDGSLDSSFGVNGKAIYPLGTGDAIFLDLAIDPAGKIVAVGRSWNGPSVDGNVVRLSSEGFTLTASSTTHIYIENASPITLDNNLTLTNSPTSSAVGATVQIGNYVRNEDVLNYTIQGGITANFDSLTGKLTLSGVAPLDDYQAVLRSLTYANTSRQPLEWYRTITITVDDGEPYHNLTSATYTIHVVAQNDAPSFITDGLLPTILQGSTTSLGQTILGIFASRFADPDNNATLQGIAVVGNAANASTEGQWQYSTDQGSNWYAVGTVVDDATALALDSNARLRFVPVLSFTGEPTPLLVRAIDNTLTSAFSIGASRQTVDVTTNGGSTPVAAMTTHLRTTVFPLGTIGNNPPLLSGVPVSANINEGQTLGFTAVGNDVDLDSVLTFSLAGAPLTAKIHPDTGVFTWLTTEADGPQTYVFNVQVSDGLALTVKTITVMVGEVNTDPTLANVPVTAKLVRGDTLAFIATATDTDLVHGLGNTLTYSLVGAPIGATIDPDNGVLTWTPADTIPTGDYTFKVRVADDGVPSLNATQTIVVTFAQSLLDNGNLRIGGTVGNDIITVSPAKDPTKVAVVLNRVKQGEYDLAAITGNISIQTGDGNDRVSISAKLTKPTLILGGSGNDVLVASSGNDSLFGGTGNDKLSGGRGDNLLVGGDGNDVLTGGVGRDVLMGGAGRDKLNAGGGDDLLIAGSTNFDTNLPSLANVVAEWTSVPRTYAERIAHLTGTSGGVNNAMFLNPTTVSDDNAKDTLIGATGLDWFVGKFAGGTLDTLDLKAGEQRLLI